MDAGKQAEGDCHSQWPAPADSWTRTTRKGAAVNSRLEDRGPHSPVTSELLSPCQSLFPSGGPNQDNQ